MGVGNVAMGRANKNRIASCTYGHASRADWAATVVGVGSSCFSIWRGIGPQVNGFFSTCDFDPNLGVFFVFWGFDYFRILEIFNLRIKEESFMIKNRNQPLVKFKTERLSRERQYTTRSERKVNKIYQIRSVLHPKNRLIRFIC